jgi:antitoxin HicB
MTTSVGVIASVANGLFDPVGSTFESWLEEEGLLGEATEHAVKAVISWQLQKTMAERGLSKKSMRAARLVGKKIKIDLVDAV